MFHVVSAESSAWMLASSRYASGDASTSANSPGLREHQNHVADEHDLPVAELGIAALLPVRPCPVSSSMHESSTSSRP